MSLHKNYLSLRWEIALVICFMVVMPAALLSAALTAWFDYHWYYAVTTALALTLMAGLVFIRTLFR